MNEGIAIIGMSCRFPGAPDLDSFWRVLHDSVDTVSEVPAERFDIDEFYDPRPGTPGKLISRWGGFVDGIDAFDAAFFGISPREAGRMDPQQRLLLETTWEAFEDAGHPLERIAGSRTGVFIGAWTSDYRDLQYRDALGVDLYASTGSARSVLAGRLSYAFDLRGPSLVVDTACSSSLVAVHLACQSLLAGESPLAVAAGVNLVLAPDESLGFSLARMLAPDGRCKSFDARADGFVRSDGIGTLVLKPTSAALADGDPIWAVILGSAVNNDGRSSGFLMTPGSGGQEAVLRDAYRAAGVAAASVQYIEAHGAGTGVGDPVEAAALGAVIGAGRAAQRPCRVGSAKSNIGHTEGAAGVAGLIKVALALKHRVLPASLHCEDPNPAIPWDDLRLVVQRATEPWPADEAPARAGVSGFGIAGTNAHVVVQAAPDVHAPEETTAAPALHLLPLSATTPSALAARSLTMAASLRAPMSGAAFRDVCYTAAVRRTHHAERRAVVARSGPEAAGRLSAAPPPERGAGVALGGAGARRPRVVFVFSGQGSQWAGMGCRLYDEEPVFRSAIDECDAAVRAHVGWSVVEHLLSEPDREGPDPIDRVQPSIFAVQLGLAALWRSWGVEPSAVLGHSMGEVAAAAVAGALTLEDATGVICRRSRLMLSLAGTGAMAVVGLSLADTRDVLRGRETHLSPAASNSQTSTVVSGDVDSLVELVAELEGHGILCRRVSVDVASHSPHVDCLREPLLAELGGLRPRPAEIAFCSTVTGEAISGPELGAAYWADNLRLPVLFAPTSERLRAAGHDVFVEISPHPVLLSSLRQTFAAVADDGDDVLLLPSLRHDEDDREVLLGSLAALYERGQDVAFDALFPDGGRCVPLPAHPWQRETYWAGASPTAPRGRRDGHPLIGRRTSLADRLDTHVWEAPVSLGTHPWLADHAVQGTALMPAAGFVEMALAGAAELLGPVPLALRDVSFTSPLFLSAETQAVQLVVTAAAPGTALFRVYSRASDAATWQQHASGSIGTAPPPDDAVPAALATLRAQLAEAETETHGALYASLAARGLEYGPAFRGVSSLRITDGEALARVRLPDEVADSGAYRIHPALLDACFQVLAGALASDDEATCLPAGLEGLRVHRLPPSQLWVHARARRLGDGDDGGDVTLYDDEGQIVAEVIGLRVHTFETSRRSAADTIGSWLYEQQWQPVGAPAGTGCAPGRWLVLGGDDRTATALRAALAGRGLSCTVVVAGDRYEAGPERVVARPECRDDIERLLKLGGEVPWAGVVHLWGLGAEPAALERAMELGCVSALHVAQVLAALPSPPPLWLVTRGAQAVGDDAGVAVAQAPILGVAKVVRYEHPELGCRCVDLDPAGSPDDVAGLVGELSVGDREPEIALRGPARLSPRLVRAVGPLPDLPEIERPVAFGSEPFALASMAPGVLDRLALRPASRPGPGLGEIEVQVHAAGLNFMDVMRALGIYPGAPPGPIGLGIECAGRVTALGAGVTELAVGDDVMAMTSASTSCFAAFVNVPASLAVRKPDALGFDEAATIPVAFITAWHSLCDLAAVTPGEKVLIHLASGGVGLAAVQIAQMLGAEVFATAGSPAKRDVLRELGVRHVMDSRSSDFAGEVMDATGGRGVDVVLNALSGDALAHSLALLAPFGRFVELGKTDIHRDQAIGLGPFRNTLSMFAVDVDRLARERHHVIANALRQSTAAIAAGALRPLPARVFGISDAVAAFRHMARAEHVGKIVLSLQDPRVAVTLPAEAALFDATASYLVTGGYGGLGLRVAGWMVAHGARHVGLVGRRGPSPDALPEIDAMRSAGAQVLVAMADVGRSEDVADLLDEMARAMPPLKGIVHAAAVLDDGILLQQDVERFRRVLAPKVHGAWNLHTATLDQPLDFFVLFSSAASLIGSPGQANYVAANAFLDALAHERRRAGRPALSINWGPWSEIGLAVRPDRGARLAGRGFGSISPELGLRALGRLLHDAPAQIGVLPLDLDRWRGFYPEIAGSPLFERLAGESPAARGARRSGDVSRAQLAAMDQAARAEWLEAMVSGHVRKVLGLGDGARLDHATPLNRLGIDSLMAVELKNRVEDDLDATLALVELLKGPSVAELAAQLAVLVEDARPGVPDTADREPDPAQLLARLDELSDADVESLLDDLSAGPV